MTKEQLDAYNAKCALIEDKKVIAIKKLISAIENDHLSWKEIIDNEDEAVNYAKRILKEYSKLDQRKNIEFDESIR